MSRTLSDVGETTQSRSAGLILLLLLLLVTRAALVLSLSDVFFYGEELAKGTAAKAMLDGIPVEHWKVNYVHHEGGGFVVTHLKALAFLLVGESVLAHKLAALAFTAAILATGFQFVLTAFGLRAATTFGFLFALAPAAFVRFSLLNLGTHFEALLFLTLVVHGTLRVAEADPPRLRHWLALGVAAGFGLYFSLQTAPAIAAAGLYLVLFARARLSLRGLALAVIGALAGVSPWLYTIAKAGDSAFRVRQVLDEQGTNVLDALGGLFEPLSSQGDVFDWVALVLYPLVIALGWALAPRGEGARWRRHALLVLFVLGFFFAAYFASGLALGSAGWWFFFLRLSTAWFFANVLFAAAVASLLARREVAARALAVGATAILCVGGLDDFAALLRTGDPTRLAANARTLATFKGYDYTEYFDKFKYHLDGSDADKIALLLHFEDDPEYLLPSIAHSVFEGSPLALEEVLAIGRDSFGAGWHVSLRGLGTYLATSAGYDVADAFAALQSAPEDTLEPLAEAIGRTGYGLKITGERIEREIAAEDVPEALRRAFLRGTGWRLFGAHRLHPERALARIEREEEPMRTWLRDGLEAAQRARSLRTEAARDG